MMNSNHKQPGTPDPGLVESLRAQYQQRTNADKRKAVDTVSQIFPQMSNSFIADVCGVSAPFVGTHRPPTREDRG